MSNNSNSVINQNSNIKCPSNYQLNQLTGDRYVCIAAPIFTSMPPNNVGVGNAVGLGGIGIGLGFGGMSASYNPPTVGCPQPASGKKNPSLVTQIVASVTGGGGTPVSIFGAAAGASASNPVQVTPLGNGLCMVDPL
jgi:hypothetical protein